MGSDAADDIKRRLERTKPWENNLVMDTTFDADPI